VVVITQTLRFGFRAFPCALLPSLAACNALTGLDQSFNEVDCFPANDGCVDGSSARGPDGAALIEGGAAGGDDVHEPDDSSPASMIDRADGSPPRASMIDGAGGSPPPASLIDASKDADADAPEGAVGPGCVPGGSCNAGDCQIGAFVCGDAGLECTSTGTLGDGIHCGTAGHVCSSGTCMACSDGVSCTPSNPCHAGTTSCATGHSLCVDSSTPLADLTPCGSNGTLVCEQGSCVVEPKRYAFLSKGTFNPSSGIGAADSMCASEALAASLPGTYLAGLSTTSAGIASRYPASGPRWFLPNATLLGDASALFSPVGPPSIALGADAAVHPPDSGSSTITTWTGCDTGPSVPTQTASQNSCSDWSLSTSRGVFGDAMGGGSIGHLYSWGSGGCAALYPVYCIQK
jgi:hypothetical protein